MSEPKAGARPWLYLASQSPRRLELLQAWGWEARVLLPDPSEDAEALERALPGETPETYVQRVTRLKLDAALKRRRRRGLPAGPVLCADTTVALGARILGKPVDEADAIRMLGTLSGRTHRVLTAVAVGARGRVATGLSRSRVRFAPMSAADIERYVASGEPMGKAGAYGIQGRAACFVQRLEGSHSGVVGLDAHTTTLALRELGLRLP